MLNLLLKGALKKTHHLLSYEQEKNVYRGKKTKPVLKLGDMSEGMWEILHNSCSFSDLRKKKLVKFYFNNEHRYKY